MRPNVGCPQATPCVDANVDKGPPYLLSSPVQTIHDVWTEFAHGRNGPPLAQLIARHGTKWRDPNVIKRSAFHDRKIVWEAIVKFAVFMAVAANRGTMVSELHDRKKDREWLANELVCLSRVAERLPKKAKVDFPGQDAKVAVVQIYRVESELCHPPYYGAQ